MIFIKIIRGFLSIEPVLNEENQNFWEEYDKFDYVEAVTFELIPPNLFV